MPFPNPPTQFKVGNPGGPGRPRKSSLIAQLEQQLWERLPDGRTTAEAIVDRWLAIILEGEPAAALAAINELGRRSSAFRDLALQRLRQQQPADPSGPPAPQLPDQVPV